MMMIDMELLQDAKGMLRQHIDSGTAIALEAAEEDELLYDILLLLHRYELAKARKITVLASYILIRSALNKHRELLLNENERLTKGILDGDYLFGLYYQILALRKEWKLFVHLTPFHKKVQVALLSGTPLCSILKDFYEELRSYLVQQSA